FTWNPDNRGLASSCGDSLDIFLWDTLTTQRRVLGGHAELVPHLAFDHRGDLLLSFSWDGSTRFWRATDGGLLFVSRAGFGLAFNRDDTKLAYMEEMQGFGIWNVSPSAVYRELTLPIGATAYIMGFDFSPDGRDLAVANPDGLHLL